MSNDEYDMANGECDVEYGECDMCNRDCDMSNGECMTCRSWRIANGCTIGEKTSEIWNVKQCTRAQD